MRFHLLLVATFFGCRQPSDVTLAEQRSPDGGSPTCLDSAELDPDVVARAAVIVGSCLPWEGVEQFLIDNYYRRRFEDQHALVQDPSMISCLASKTTGCDALKECTGIDVSAETGCPTTCAGTNLDWCDVSFRYRIDCARFGLTCSVDNLGCVPAPRPCVQSDWSCQGGRPIGCSDGVGIAGPICADHGLTCATTDLVTSCQGAEGSCAPILADPFTISFLVGRNCVDKCTLESCVAGGIAFQDCSTVAAGFTCQAGSSKTFCGLAAECDPLSNATCEGTTLTLCNGGRVDRIDCASLGFTGCDAEFGVCTPSPYSAL